MSCACSQCHVWLQVATLVVGFATMVISMVITYPSDTPPL